MTSSNLSALQQGQPLRQAAPPPGARDDLWIVTEVGRRLSPPVPMPAAADCLRAALDAGARGCTLRVPTVDRDVWISGDRDSLLSALANLLQNAFKFTHARTEVTLTAHAVGDRVLIEVQDQCGGLAVGTMERMFVPFAQRGDDRTGLGLGLSIARHKVEAEAGTLGVRNLPGVGCAFTIDLPRCSAP